MIVAQPALPLLVAASDPGITGASYTLSAVAAGNLAVLRLRRARFAFTGVGVAAYLLGALAVAGALLAALVALLLPDSVAALVAASGALLTPVLLLVVAAVLARSPIAQALSGGLLVGAFAVAGVRLVVASSDGYEPILIAVLVAVLAAAVTVVARWLPAPVRVGPWAGALVVVAVPAMIGALAAAVSASRSIIAAMPPLNADPSAVMGRAQWQVPAALAVLTAAVTILVTSRTTAAKQGASRTAAIGGPLPSRCRWSAPRWSPSPYPSGSGCPGRRLWLRPARRRGRADSRGTAVGRCRRGAGRRGAGRARGARRLRRSRPGGRHPDGGRPARLRDRGSGVGPAGPDAAGRPGPDRRAAHRPGGRLDRNPGAGPFAAGAGARHGGRDSTAGGGRTPGRTALVRLPRLRAGRRRHQRARTADLGAGRRRLTCRLRRPRPDRGRVRRAATVRFHRGAAALLGAALALAVAPSVVEVLAGPYRWWEQVWVGAPAGTGLDPAGRDNVAVADVVAIALLAAAGALWIAGYRAARRHESVAVVGPVAAVVALALPMALAAAGFRWPTVPLASLLTGLICLILVARTGGVRAGRRRRTARPRR